MTYKQTVDVRGLHSIPRSLSDSVLRIPQNGVLFPVDNEKIFTERGYLNFEVVNGEICPVDKTMPLDIRLKASLTERGIDIDKTKHNITAMCIALGGTRERMQEMAFGRNGMSIIHDPSAVLTRHSEIEEWGKDMYSFLSSEFSVKNNIAFVVNLDVYNPTAYAFIIPVDENNRFIFSRLFKGLKYQSRSKMMLFHDKVAAVNKKYHLERGDNRYFTYNHNRASEMYLEFLNARKKELDGEIEKLRQEYSEVVKDSQAAERKVKSLLTMVDNANIKLNETKEQLKDLVANKGSVDPGNVQRPEVAQMHAAFKDKERELDFLNDEEQRLDNLISDKKAKLGQAQDNLIKVLERKRQMQEPLDKALHKIEAMKEDKMSYCLYKVYSVLVEIILNECKVRQDEGNGFYKSVLDIYSEPIVKTTSLLSLGLNIEASEYARISGAKNAELLMSVSQNDNENEMDWVSRCYEDTLSAFKGC